MRPAAYEPPAPEPRADGPRNGDVPTAARKPRAQWSAAQRAAQSEKARAVWAAKRAELRDREAEDAIAPPSPKRFWTRERHAALAAALAEGLNAREAAQRLSRAFRTPVTTASVIGRAARTGLTLRGGAAVPRRLVWTADADAVIRRGVALRHSAVAIAAQLPGEAGLSCSPRAVRRRIAHLGLAFKAAPALMRPREARAVPPARAMPDPVAEARDEIAPDETRETVASDTTREESAARGVALLDLGRDQCRWPLGARHERAHFFCGEPNVFGSSYCPAHRLRSVTVRADCGARA